MSDEHYHKLLRGESLAGEWFFPPDGRRVGGSLVFKNNVLQLVVVRPFVEPESPGMILEAHHYPTIHGVLDGEWVTLVSCVGQHKYTRANVADPGTYSGSYHCQAALIGDHIQPEDDMVSTAWFSTNRLGDLFEVGWNHLRSVSIDGIFKDDPFGVAKRYSAGHAVDIALSTPSLSCKAELRFAENNFTVRLQSKPFADARGTSVEIGARHWVEIDSSPPLRLSDLLPAIDTIHSMVSVFLCSFDPFSEFIVRFAASGSVCLCVVSIARFEPQVSPSGNRAVIRLFGDERLSRALAGWFGMFGQRRHLRDLFESGLRRSDIALNTRTVFLIQFLEWFAEEAVETNSLLPKPQFKELRKQLETQVEAVFCEHPESQQRIKNMLLNSNNPNLKDRLMNLADMLHQSGVRLSWPGKNPAWSTSDYVESAFKLRNNVSHGSDPKKGRAKLPRDVEVGQFIRQLAVASVLYRLGCTGEECDKGAIMLPDGWLVSS